MHYYRVKDYYNGLRTINININTFKDKKQITIIDAFIFCFVKLQDFMERKLFKDLLTSIGLYKNNMSLLDVVDQLEKIEIIDDTNKLMEFRQIRNQLSHEYPNNESDIIDGIHIALRVFEQIEIILTSINNYIKLKNFIKGYI